MKISLERGALLRVLGHVQSVVERRNSIPILSNVLISAENGAVTMTATDLDLQINETFSASVSRPGRVTVNAHTFHDIIRKMPDGCQIELDASDDRMLITGGRARFTLPMLPPEDFPIISTGEFTTTFELSSEMLSQLFGRVRFAISTEETRYYLNGIFLHIIDNQLLAVATDGHRLARAVTEKPADADFEGIIVPRKCVGEILKVVDEVEGNVVISINTGKIRFDFGHAIYVSKLVNGTFPDYQRVIPSHNSKKILITANELAQSIDRVATIATERTRAVKVDLQDGKLVLSVSSPEHGIATEEVEAEYAGAGLEIGFNARYFLDILSQHRDGQLEVAMEDPTAPVLIQPVDSVGDCAVIMPMRC